MDQRTGKHGETDPWFWTDEANDRHSLKRVGQSDLSNTEKKHWARQTYDTSPPLYSHCVTSVKPGRDSYRRSGDLSLFSLWGYEHFTCSGGYDILRLCVWFPLLPGSMLRCPVVDMFCVAAVRHLSPTGISKVCHCSHHCSPGDSSLVSGEQSCRGSLCPLYLSPVLFSPQTKAAAFTDCSTLLNQRTEFSHRHTTSTHLFLGPLNCQSLQTVTDLCRIVPERITHTSSFMFSVFCLSCSQTEMFNEQSLLLLLVCGSDPIMWWWIIT